MLVNAKEKNEAEERDREYFCGVVIWKGVVREDLTEDQYLSKDKAEVRETILQRAGGGDFQAEIMGSATVLSI